MIPIGDEDSHIRTTPVVSYVIIALNILVFLLELSIGDSFIIRWAFIPSRFAESPLSDSITVFTSMFMHAGWLHLGGNMLYLWVFGNNVEDRFGHIKFIIFYLFINIF